MPPESCVLDYYPGYFACVYRTLDMNVKFKHSVINIAHKPMPIPYSSLCNMYFTYMRTGLFF